MTTHEIDELKKAILHIAKTDSDFFADLIGEVVKGNLHIKEQQRDFYADFNSHVNPKLSWGPSPGESDDFSYA